MYAYNIDTYVLKQKKKITPANLWYLEISEKNQLSIY